MESQSVLRESWFPDQQQAETPPHVQKTFRAKTSNMSENTQGMNKAMKLLFDFA